MPVGTKNDSAGIASVIYETTLAPAYKGETPMLLREDKSQKPDFVYLGMMYGALDRVVRRFMMGEEKYARGNWREAKEVLTYQQSAIRHLMQYLSGDDTEDHLAATAANVLILIDLEEQK